jgi:hypothetical protein
VAGFKSKRRLPSSRKRRPPSVGICTQAKPDLVEAIRYDTRALAVLETAETLKFEVGDNADCFEFAAPTRHPLAQDFLSVLRRRLATNKDKLATLGGEWTEADTAAAVAAARSTDDIDENTPF